MRAPDLAGQLCLVCRQGHYRDVSPLTGPRLVRCDYTVCTDLRERFYVGTLYGFAPNGRFYHVLRFKDMSRHKADSKHAVRSNWVDCSGWQRIPREIPPRHKLPCRRCVVGKIES